MIHEVKVFDGAGKLKEIIQPVFDYDNKAYGTTTTKICPECGKSSKQTGNQKYCSSVCGKAFKHRAEKIRRDNRNKAQAEKPPVPCEMCGKPVAKGRLKYCGKACDSKARKVKAMSKHAITKELINLKRQEIKNEQIANA